MSRVITKQRLDKLIASAERMDAIGYYMGTPPSAVLAVGESLREAWRLADEQLQHHRNFVVKDSRCWCPCCQTSRAILPGDWSE